jgi:putative MATE family efflux protein
LRDLTVGSVGSHLVRLTLPIAAGMVFQTLYFIVDLYFVSRLGNAAIAGVAAAGSVVFLVTALTQTIGAGALALLSQAVGRKDADEAGAVFNQAASLSALCALATLAFGVPLAALFMNAVSADAATAHAGSVYLDAFLPGLSVQFLMTAMTMALRATGNVRPTMIVQSLGLTLNILLAPVLIAGWLTGAPFGVAGAGLASTLSMFAALGLLLVYFRRFETYVRFDLRLWFRHVSQWPRIMQIGFPAGGEIAFAVVYSAVTFTLIRHFGEPAQAGFGVGSRLMQAIFLPSMAIAFAAAPVAGQNFGAGEAARVRATLRAAMILCCALMLPLTALCQIAPQWLILAFTHDPGAVAQGTLFLRILSWNFVTTGIVFSCSAMFQALGNTWPALLSTSTRLVTFVVPGVLMSRLPQFRIEHLWYLSVATLALQAATSLFLVAREFRRRLNDAGEKRQTALAVPQTGAPR